MPASISCGRAKFTALSFFVTLVLGALVCLPAAAAEGPDCVMCHEALTKGKVVHAAVQMGCPTCHSAIDASKMPHAKTNKITRGLSSELPDLCYSCHDRNKLTGKFMHAPVGIGMCTSCHNPHRSDNAKLLVSPPPGLCFSCHQKKDFEKKNVHAPAAGGMCLSCHAPHSGENMALLVKDPTGLCLGCHAGVRKKPHAVAGFAGTGHPVGLQSGRKKQPDDPSRPGKKFYCGSCHNPHSSDSIYLFRYPARSAMGLCTYCHKM